ncbi:MAG: S8 family serine peptidase [Shewanella sp.]|uniref:S8 family serine peptidase n=1 Tax=Shewanella sp. TaxID=50422 RepID=UPI003F2BC101
MGTHHKLGAKTLIATLTACYFAGISSAIAEPAKQTKHQSGFYIPAFNKQDVQNINAQYKSALEGNIFVGQPGQKNQHTRQSQPTSIFKPTPGLMGKHNYIVQLKHDPLATYGGGIRHFTATKAPNNRSVIAKGRVSLNTANAQAYQSFLKQQQQGVIQQAQQKGAHVQLKKQLTIANNAIIVEMTESDAQLMATMPGIQHISLERVMQLSTDRGPQFIDGPVVWSGGTDAGVSAKGEGMVVGIIDTGINTDHTAFASDDDYAAANPLGAGKYLGDCVASPELCNNKLIGVRSYREITDVYSAPEFQAYPWQQEQIRPANGEDYNGHGSHTASTTAGNSLNNTPLQAAGAGKTSDGVDLPFNFASTSGVAPRAHIISYQVCWPGGSGDPYAGCPESAILAAIEDAIQDGVDSINFSIGGAEQLPWTDPVELAFLSAREAGINVAAAAGNAGQFWSADHSSPWLTSVGAITHDRVLDSGNKTLGQFQGDQNSRPYNAMTGKSYSGSITGEVVLAGNYPDPDPSDNYSAASCNAPFPEGTFNADHIVVCERGAIPRTDKAIHVQAGGGGGMILLNVDWQVDNVAADAFVIPGIHLEARHGWSLRRWIQNSQKAGKPAIATISDFTNDYIIASENGNILAPFSSMGPSKTNDTLVPNLAAPGVDIYAANADDQPFTTSPAPSDWTFMSGTSMAAPHVTGAMTLLSQLNPQWTPAEVQSALMLTAGDVLVQSYEGLIKTNYNFMAGAGGINVARAANSGLIMDESIENYRQADPSNGGIVSWLNTPAMVDMQCEQTCRWMRTVTATKDGQWQASTTAIDPEFELSVEPTSFSLKAGQSQTLIITAKLPGLIEHKVNPEDGNSPWDNVVNNYTFFDGQLKLTEVQNKSPDLHMPISVGSLAEQMPSHIEVNIGRDQGTESLSLNTDSYSQLTPRFYGPVKPQTYDVNLEAVGPFIDPEAFKIGWDIRQITVPENTKRLVVEVQRAHFDTTAEEMAPRYNKPFPYIMVGLDGNGNNSFMSPGEDDSFVIKDEYDQELVCISSSQAEHNYCSIENPRPGNYWVATTMPYGEGKINATTGYAIIGADSDNGQLSLSGPQSHDGTGEYQLELKWNIPNTTEGEVYYGGIDLGAGPGAEGSFGFSAINLRRGEDALRWTVSQDSARVEDQVDIEVKLAGNLESQDRDYKLDIKLPEGMRLITDSIRSNNEDVAAAIQSSPNQLSLAGRQLSGRNIKRDYKVSTNLSDAMCKTPLIDEHSKGGYIDLFAEFGIQPNAEWFVGDAGVNFDVPIDWLFYKENAEFKLYNQLNAGYMRMHPAGAMQFNPGYWYMYQHRGPGFLMEALAPFWRGSFTMDSMRHWEDPIGLTLANQYAEERPDLGDLLFMEFDNVTDSETGETFDFQTILRSGIDDHQGKYEIIFAYDNLGADLRQGAVFIEGFDSAWSRDVGPKEGLLYQVIGVNNLDEVLKDDLVICFDYQGPEQTEVKLSFKAAIQPQAIGQELNIKFAHDLQGATPATLTHSIKVNSNLKLADIADMTVAENGRIDGIKVNFIDADKVPNSLKVSGENLTAEINGNSINLIPKANFHGTIPVTVTVADTLHPSDMASTQFILTVVSDGIEPKPPTPPTPPTTPPSNESSGGGALGYWLLLLLPMLYRRRK